MTFNSAGQYSGNHKPWDHVGNAIPDIEHCEGERPSFEFQPAKWLPVQFWDKHFENWIVVMPGKIVALDQDGFVMPGQYADGVAASTTVAYTANDVAAGTIDITTGEAVTTAVTRTLSGIDGSSLHFMGRQGIAWEPADYAIGVAPFAYLQHPGGDGHNPADFTFHNYNMQHQVTVLCDYVLKLPLVPGQSATEALGLTWAASAITLGTDDGWRTRTYIQATARYDKSTGFLPCLDTYPVAANPLEYFPVATNTGRTTFVCSSTTLLITEKSTMGGIQQAGDYFVDYEGGVLFCYSAGGSSLPVSGATTLTYYHYAAVPAVLSKYACVLGNTTELIPGDFLVCTTDSNWTRVATPGPAATTANFANVMGQVLAIYQEPRDFLDRVRTAYSSLNTNASGAMKNATAATSSVGLGQLDQMPGSATGGVSDLVHYAGAADLVVLVNLINR